MSTNFTEPMGWDATGVAPSDTLKTNGFNAGDKPPASVFNYFLNNTSTCLKELQQNARDVVFIVNATSTDGMAYTATDARISELRTGLTILMIPDKTTTKIANASNLITLNINNLGAKAIMRKISTGTSTPVYNTMATWLSKDIPTLLTYTGTRWLALDFTKPAASDIHGTITYGKGGTSAESRELALAYFGAYTDDTDVPESGREVGLPWSVPLTFKTLDETGLTGNGCYTSELLEGLPTNTTVAFTHAATASGNQLSDAPCENGYCILFRGNNAVAFGGVMYSNAGNVYSYSHQNNEWYEIYTSRSVDSTPTANSDNLITSGGVYSAIPKYMHNVYIRFSDMNGSGNVYFSYFNKNSTPRYYFDDIISDIASRELGASGTISVIDGIIYECAVTKVKSADSGASILRVSCHSPSQGEYVINISADNITYKIDTVQSVNF